MIIGLNLKIANPVYQNNLSIKSNVITYIAALKFNDKKNSQYLPVLAF